MTGKSENLKLTMIFGLQMVPRFSAMSMMALCKINKVSLCMNVKEEDGNIVSVCLLRINSIFQSIYASLVAIFEHNDAMEAYRADP